MDNEQTKAIFTNNWSQYKSLRNTYTNTLKTAKNNDIQNKLDEQSGDQKGMWRVLKEILNGKSKTKIQEVIFNGIKCVSNEIIAENFNNYFIESIETLNREIEIIQEDPQAEFNIIEVNFEFTSVSIKDIQDVFKSMKSKYDYEQLSSKILLDALPYLGSTLQNIYNNSFLMGIFPSCWKNSVVVPVAKIKGAINCEHFRPINMLPTYEKGEEALAKIQIEKFLKENNVLVKEQSGYRSNHSCETTLNYVICEWKDEVDRKKIIIAVFLDFQRAFETIDRERLLNKLDMYGFRGNSNK